jgi:hypothetical protein
MSSIMMQSVDESLQQTPLEEKPFHPVIRAAARVISVVFHPLFIPVYLSWFLLYINPIFPAFSPWAKTVVLLRFLVMYTLFPIVTVLLLKGLGFIDSIFLKNQKDRIIPYVASGVYYFWMWYTLRNQPEFPRELVLLTLAIFLASSGGILANSYLKVSMHALSVGVMVTYVLLMAFFSEANFGVYISVAFLIGGAVCTSRLVTLDHHPAEVYIGLFIGILAQVIAYVVMY